MHGKEKTLVAETLRIKEIYEKDVNNINDVYETLEDENSKNVNGYVKEGLMLYYDFKESNEVKGSIVKDLSRNGNDGTINGAALKDGSLNFDGIDDWVAIKQMNYQNITIEAVIEYETILEDQEMGIVSNFETGGYALSNYSIMGSTPYNKFTAYIDDTYYSVESSQRLRTNYKYFLSGNYNGKVLTLSENGNITTIQKQGTIKYPQNNTIMILGANPNGNSAFASYFNGKVYSIRIYNRALTKEEIQKNYEVDMLRFQK